MTNTELREVTIPCGESDIIWFDNGYDETWYRKVLWVVVSR